MMIYTPRSLLSQFNKIFEKLLHNCMYFYLTKFNLYSERQFGLGKIVLLLWQCAILMTNY